jgi:hypothetical protein
MGGDCQVTELYHWLDALQGFLPLIRQINTHWCQSFSRHLPVKKGCKLPSVLHSKHSWHFGGAERLFHDFAGLGFCQAQALPPVGHLARCPASELSYLTNIQDLKIAGYRSGPCLPCAQPSICSPLLVAQLHRGALSVVSLLAIWAPRDVFLHTVANSITRHSGDEGVAGTSPKDLGQVPETPVRYLTNNRDYFRRYVTTSK